MKLKGAYILFTAVIGGSTTALALCRDTNLSASLDMKEVASAASADAKEYVAGRISWDLSAAHIVGNFSPNLLSTLISNKTPISVNIHSDEDDDNLFSIVGTAYLKSYKMGAPLHEFATADVEWQGTDKITALDLSLPKILWTEDDDSDIYTWDNARWNDDDDNT